MDMIIRKLSNSRPLTLGAVVLYGVIEFVALRRHHSLAQDVNQD